MEENNEGFEEFAQKHITYKEKFITWEREYYYLLGQQDDLRIIEPNVGTEEHIEWLINMTYVHKLRQEHKKKIDDLVDHEISYIIK
tara:strand:+ start:462 stop:719 length:258 start_codon:yes stop_codon:yes gene_type:complete